MSEIKPYNDKELLDFLESQHEVHIRKTDDNYRIWTIPFSPAEESGKTLRAAIKLSAAKAGKYALYKKIGQMDE